MKYSVYSAALVCSGGWKKWCRTFVAYRAAIFRWRKDVVWYPFCPMAGSNFSQPEFTPHHRTKGILYYIFYLSEDSHTIHNNRPAPFFPSTWANQGSTVHTVLHTMYTRFIRLDCSFSDDWDLIINLPLTPLNAELTHWHTQTSLRRPDPLAPLIHSRLWDAIQRPTQNHSTTGVYTEVNKN